MTTETVSIDGSAFAAAAKALASSGFEELAGKTVKTALRRSANVVRANVRAAAAKRHHRTGRLEAGVHTSWRGAGLAFALRVSATSPEANLIVYGVRPHRILAHAHPLRVGGAKGFAESVEHPGFRGDPFVNRGVQASMPAIQAIVTAAGEQMAAELAKRMRSTP